MRWLWWLALRELQARRGRSLLSLLALALSVGLVVATGSIGALMRASVAAPLPLLAGPAGDETLWISSAYDVDYDLPASLAAQVEAVPGVAGVQPILRRPARVQTPPGAPGTGSRIDTLTLLGVEPAGFFAAHDLALAAGRLPSAGEPGLVALAPWAFVRELGLGSPVTVTIPGGEVVLPVAGLLEVESLAEARQGLVLYLPLQTMAELYGLDDAVTAVEVQVVPGASPRRVRERLERVLGPAYAVTAASGAGQGTRLWQRLVLGALAFVDVLALVGSGMLVYAVFAVAARSRQREIGLLRAAGTTRGQALGLLLAEATLLGAAGSAAGLVLGVGLARLGAGLVLERAGPPPFPPLPPGWLVLSLGLGPLISLGGAIVPALRTARQTPLAALYALPPSPAQPSGRGRSRPGLLSLAGTCPPEVHLGLAGLFRERRRAVRIAAAMALVLAMVLGDVGVLSLLGEELSAAVGRLAGGDYLVLPGLSTISLRELAGQDTSDVPPLSPGLLAVLEDMGDQVRLMRGTTADVEVLQVFPGGPTLLLDVESYLRMGNFRFHEGGLSGALEAFRQGPAVLLVPVVARRLGVGLGDVVPIDTPQGSVGFRVAGIGDSEFTTCILDLADGATYLGANEVNAVLIQIRPGADPGAVRRALLDAIQGHGGTLLSLSQASAQMRDVFGQMRSYLALLIAITGLVAGLGIVNATLASVAERRREFGLLRAVGATRQQVHRSILVEMALLGAVAALAGIVLGWAATLLFLAVARSHLGLAATAASSPGAWLPLLGASLGGLLLWPLLAALGGLIPARQAARQPVVQALYEIAPG